MTEPAAGAVRRQFLRCRRRVLGAASVTVAAVAAYALLLLAPNRLAGLRLAEVALAWWVTGVLAVIGLIVVGRGLRASDSIDARAGRTSRVLPVALALVWGSPALWLGLPPLLLGDGIRGLWPAAVTMGGAVVAVLFLGTPLGGPGGPMARTSGALRVRWPAARGSRALLGSIEALVAVLFVWAQFAAVRELGTIVGWPRASTIGAAVAVALGTALLRDLSRVRVAAVGGGLALLGLAVPLILIALGTTIGWPGVWSAVASRPRIAFIEGTSWTLEGGAVRGPGPTMTMHFADEQRITFADPGRVILEPRDGKPVPRGAQTGDELSLHPGDRLIVSSGMRLRFEPGRRVPDAPDSGPAWVDPPTRDPGWFGLLALGLTGLLGTVGMPIVATYAGPAGLPPRRDAQLTAGLVMAGAALAVGWSLYAVWLTPEVYAGGVTGPEVYALPGSLAPLGDWGGVLTWLALGGLAMGGVASALAGLRGLAGVASSAPVAARGCYRIAPLVLGVGLLASFVPVGSWTLLLLALGVAASALAPAAVLTGWSERARPGGIAAGAAVGLLTFALVALVGIASSGGPGSDWGSAIAAGPATLAVPAHLLVAWLLRARRPPAHRPPAGLDDMAAAAPPSAG